MRGREHSRGTAEASSKFSLPSPTPDHSSIRHVHFANENGNFCPDTVLSQHRGGGEGGGHLLMKLVAEIKQADTSVLK